jgi:hypothetical protein
MFAATRSNTLEYLVVHALDRLLYAVQHISSTGALLLMGLSALAITGFALWTLLAVIRVLVGARGKR